MIYLYFMAYNIANIDLEKYNVYYHIPTFSLVAVEKEESKKFIFLTADTVEGVFLAENKAKGYFEMTRKETQAVNVTDLKNLFFKYVNEPARLNAV